MLIRQVELAEYTNPQACLGQNAVCLSDLYGLGLEGNVNTL